MEYGLIGEHLPHSFSKIIHEKLAPYQYDMLELAPDEIDASRLRFRTKGDANAAADEALVSDSNVVGTPLFSLPLAGYAVNYVQHPPGLFVAAGTVLIVLAAAFIPPLLDREEEKKD